MRVMILQDTIWREMYLLVRILGGILESSIHEETAEYETSQYQYQATYTHARDNRHNKNTMHNNKQYNTIRRHKRTSTFRKLATVNAVVCWWPT